MRGAVSSVVADVWRNRGFPAAFASLVLACVSCAGVASDPREFDPARYRLAGGGTDWRQVGNDHVLADLQPRYSEFFAVVLDPQRSEEPDIRPIRADLERAGSGRARFDALNAVAIAYFELNARAQRSLLDPGGGAGYLSDSFRATKLLSIPWRAYRDIQDPALRDAILDFYADIAAGEKRESRETAPRILRIVASLEQKESDPDRIERIRSLTERLQAMQDAARR
jgi:hypothetical protein